MNENLKYPSISDKLISCLERDFPDKIERKELSPFQQGVQVGIQTVIDKLKFEASEKES